MIDNIPNKGDDPKIEYLGDGNAIVRYSDDTERLVPADDLINPDFTTTVANTWQVLPTFPFTVNFDGVSIKLNADGTWEGDIVAMKQAAKESKGLGDAGLLIWLLLRQLMRDDERFW